MDNKRRNWIIVGLVLILVLAIAASSDQGKKERKQSQKAAATTTSPKVRTTQPKVDNRQSQQDAWIAAYGGDVVTTLDDLQMLKDDVDAGESDAVLAADCAIIKSDTDMVLGNPPMPDAQQAVDLAGFTSNLGTAMDACVALAVNGDQSAADLFESSFTAAMDYATKLTNDLGIGA